jgi:hypothetical protein
VPVGSSLKVDSLGMLVRLRVYIGGRQHCHNLVALLQANAPKLNVLPYIARLRELHR